MIAKSKNILWIGGWASNLACWQDQIEKLYPEYNSIFLDSNLNLDANVFKKLIKEFYEKCVLENKQSAIVAWSMGSLLLHQYLIENDFVAEDNFLMEKGLGVSLRLDLKIVSMCPIFDFCHSSGPWSPVTLESMIRSLKRNHEYVLNNFWTKVKGCSQVTDRVEESWAAQSKTYSLESLQNGLEFLKNVKLEPSKLKSANKLFFLSSEKDPITPIQFIPDSNQCYQYPEGHLPFLDYPEIVRKLL